MMDKIYLYYKPSDMWLRISENGDTIVSFIGQANWFTREQVKLLRSGYHLLSTIKWETTFEEVTPKIYREELVKARKFYVDSLEERRNWIETIDEVISKFDKEFK